MIVGVDRYKNKVETNDVCVTTINENFESIQKEGRIFK